MKVCSKCNTEKDESLFTRNKRSADRLQYECNSCIAAKKRERYNSENEHQRYLRNIEKIKIRSRKYRLDNRKLCLERTKKWSKEHLPLLAHKRSMFRKSLIKATPQWLTEEQKLQMLYFYKYSSELSRIFNNNYQVDHIHPLKGKTCSGLNVPWNLQILTAYENQVKSNKLILQ